MNFSLPFFPKKKAFGGGKWAIAPAALEEAMRLKRLGLSTNAVAKATKLNRRTVDHYWREQQSLDDLVEDLGKTALQKEPDLAEEAGRRRALGEDRKPTTPRRRAVKAPEPAALPPDDLLIRQVKPRIAFRYLRYLERYDTAQLARYGRAVLDHTLFGDEDPLDRLAQETISGDLAFRRELAELAVAERAAAAAPPKPALRQSGTSTKELRRLARLLEQRQQTEAATSVHALEMAQAVFGPGGSGTYVLSLLAAWAGLDPALPPARLPDPSLPAPKNQMPGSDPYLTTTKNAQT